MNPVIFSLFGYEVRWYSVLMLTGMIISVIMLIKEGKRFNIPKDFLFNLAFWVIVIGLICARLYYCAFNFELYKDNLVSILYVWEGGLAIHGGLIGGVITLIIYAKRYNVNPTKVMDMTVVPLLLAQAIGRWGNFFNSEAHGAATTFYHLRNELHIPAFIVDGMKINNVYYHPTFFYESLWCLIGFIILLFVRRYRYIKRGQLTCLYMMYYSVGRFFIENLRTDSLMLGPFKVAQLVSVIMFIVGLIIFMILGRKGKFEDLYNEDQRGPVRF